MRLLFSVDKMLLFVDSHTHSGCLSNCSVINSKPTLRDMERGTTYQIRDMIISFSQFSLIRLMSSPCDSENEDVNIYLRCGGNYIYGKQVPYTNKCEMTRSTGDL